MESKILKFLGFMWNPLSWVMEAAALMAIALAHGGVEKGQKATDTLNGSPLDSGPTTPLPDKKLLVFILGRLQKKDTYGVFSEPVDPNELPDYHEIVERPMDFRTVRKNLEEGRYSNLDEFQVKLAFLKELSLNAKWIL